MGFQSTFSFRRLEGVDARGGESDRGSGGAGGGIGDCGVRACGEGMDISTETWRRSAVVGRGEGDKGDGMGNLRDSKFG